MNTQTDTKRMGRAVNPEHIRDPHRRIQAASVRHICGGVSDMTLWRWLDNPELEFPRPAYIGRRRFWREAEIISWLDSQTAVAS